MNIKSGILNEKLDSLVQDIKTTCADIEPPREPQDVKILAVTKRKSLEHIDFAYNCGIRDFGENYVQEAESKIGNFEFAAECNWHLIGNLQSNKIKTAAKIFDWIHTVEKIKTVKKLGSERIAIGKIDINSCVQINLGNEETKSGILVTELADFLTATKDIKGIKIKGLMCIPEANLDDAGKRKRFAELRNLFNQYKDQYPNFDTLSMGMSGDYQLAIKEGATIIRIGSLLFGART